MAKAYAKTLTEELSSEFVTPKIINSSIQISSFHNSAIFSKSTLFFTLQLYGKYSTVFLFDPPTQNTLWYYIALHSIYVTGFAKTVPNGTRIEIPFIAWHES